ncbi:MAG: TrkH family potassium uptake protein [Marinicella sp.]
MILPLMMSLFEVGTLDQEVFALICALCLIIGYLGVKLNLNSFEEISSKELYLTTICSWLILGFIGALPFLFALQKITITDALFESFSGITTTGSTVLSNLSQMPPSLLLWRGILQWVGGIGIVVLSIAVLPHLKVGGMKLFATESSDWSSKTHPRANKMIVSILSIYILLTFTCALIYLIGGMNAFDAVVHAMTTLSTGGFANYDSSFGYFSHNPILIWTANTFMVLGALPFVFYVNLLSRSHRNFGVDSQILGFFKVLGITIFSLTIVRSFTSDETMFEILNHVCFNIISVITTTGFASTDYTLWGEFAVMFFFYLMFIGGCSGSTSGSVKIFRYQLAYLMLKSQLRRMTHPNGVYVLKYNQRLVDDGIIRSVVAFSIMFVLTIAIIAMLLTLFGLDFITSISAAATAVTNVGPGLGDTIGPSGNFSSLPDLAKILLCVGMLVGRLEVMTVFVVLTPSLWNRWNR